MKIMTELGLGFGGQILFAAVLGIAILLGMAEVERQFSFVVEHDASAIANSRHLSKLVVDMETGQRGFCITYQEEFLEPYHSGVTEFDALIKEQKKLVSDNPNQTTALERIEHLVHQWKTKAAEPEIAMARKVATHVIDAQHLQEVLRRGVGKQLMDEIMALGHEIEVAFSDREDWEGAFVVEVIEKSMTDREDGQRGFLITGQEEFLEKYTAGEQKKLPEYFARLRAIISERKRGDELSEKVDQLERLTHEWTEKSAEPEIAARREMNAHPETQEDVAALLAAGTGKALLDEIRGEFDKLIAIETRLTADRYRIASDTTAWTRTLAAGLLVFAISVGILIAVLFSHIIARPLVELAKGADAIGRGDLDTQIYVRSSDEVGVLARAFNAMASNLKESAFKQKQAEAGLLRARDELEVRVSERTAELEHSEARYQDLYDNAPDMFFSVDASSTRVTQCNRTLLTATGFLENDITGSGMFDLFHPDSLPAVQRAFHTFVNTGRSENVSLLLLRSDSGTIDVSLNVSAVRNADGKITHSRSTMRDITEHKRAEELIRRQQEELSHAARLSSMGEMATGLAHELNQPLTAIAAYADGAVMRIRRGKVEIDDLAKVFDRITADAHRAGEVIRRLRRFVKKRTAGRVLSDINETVREVCRFVGAEASQRETSLHLNLADGLPHVPADAVQVQQVVLNLIRNALDAMRDADTTDRRVSIETRETETHGVEVIVQDTGPGISPGLRDQAFEQFFTSKADGLGMGLAISQSIIEAHGGRIWFASPSGGGAQVHITLSPDASEPEVA